MNNNVKNQNNLENLDSSFLTHGVQYHNMVKSLKKTWETNKKGSFKAVCLNSIIAVVVSTG